MLSHYSEYEETLELARQFHEAYPLLRIEWHKTQYAWLAHLPDGEHPVFSFKPPLIFPVPSSGEDFSVYLQRIPELAPDFLIILIQAGHAALGHYEADALLNHKVIRKYMVRAKQGKAQISHLKTKGKSRAGSRVRLAQTEEFFDEISEKLFDWEVDEVDYIFYASAIHWWNILFEADTPPPFTKQDARLLKIPLDVNTPNFEELQRIYQSIRTAHWLYEESWENTLFPI